jgi:hypothetical protein
MFIPKILTYPYLVSGLESRYLHQNLPICRCKLNKTWKLKMNSIYGLKKVKDFWGYGSITLSLKVKPENDHLVAKFQIVPKKYCT